MVQLIYSIFFVLLVCEAGGAAHLFNLFVGVLFFSFFSAAASGGIFELPTYVRTYALGAIPTFRVFPLDDSILSPEFDLEFCKIILGSISHAHPRTLATHTICYIGPQSKPIPLAWRGDGRFDG